MYVFLLTVTGTPWDIKCGSKFPKLLGAAATSLWGTTKFVSGIAPDAESLAHEWYHIVTTNPIRYALSYTIGRLWKDKYHTTQEIGANLFGSLHSADPIFLHHAQTIRDAVPTEWKTVTIKHKV